MKKFAFLLTIIFCFSLLGCGTAEQENTAQQPTETATMTDVPTEVTNPIAEIEETMEPTTEPMGNVANGQSDVRFLYAGSLEEYEKHFAENGGYPENFVTYEDLRELGSFKSFHCQSYNMLPNVDEKTYTTYGYEIQMDGIVFSFSIRNNKRTPETVKNLEWEDVKAAMDTSDLRTNGADVFKREDIFRGKIVCGEYTYKYIEGKLSKIVWIVGETEITISKPSLRNPWPENDPDTLIGRMLIWDTAEEALGELREKIDGKLKDLKYPD